MELPEEPILEFPLLSDPNNKICEHCGAMLWKEEMINCCSNGEYAVDNLPPLPPEVQELFDDPSFITNQRKLNNLTILRSSQISAS